MSQPASKPDLTVLTCTHNPRPDVLAKVLDAIMRQTLPQGRWEYLIVDNNSNPPLELEELNRDRGLPMRIIYEFQPGVAAARRRGTGEAAADVIVMIDDDNIVDPDYLEVGLKIANSEPALGAFGGIARPLLETGTAKPWQAKLFGYLGIRDFGQAVITSNEDRWGEWEPIGAGMVLRKDVALKFIEMMNGIPLAFGLGRKGKSLMAGEDSLLARASYRLGYACSYQPDLKMSHYIKKPRLKLSYLVPLLYGMGRSTVMLNIVLSLPSEKLGLKELFQRLRYRWSKDGFGGVVIWAWDVGYFVECRAKR